MIGGVGQPRLQRRRQLDGEQIEHGQREHHHQRAGAQHHRRLLQPYRQQRAGEAGDDADHGVSQRQALHIGEGQQETAAAGQCCALAGNQ